MHLDQRAGGADRLQSYPSQNGSRADHNILANQATLQNCDIWSDVAARANPHIAFVNPGGGMDFGRRMDVCRKIVPVKAAKREFIVKIREDGPRLLAHRNRQAERKRVHQLGGGQNSANKTISPERFHEGAVLQEYQLLRAGIAKKPERLKVSVAADCDAGCTFQFA
jgi:hypothetical protein